MASDTMGFREALKVFGRDVSFYSAQSILIRAGQFALLPVYLTFLGPQDFGLLALAAVYGTFVSVFLGLGLDAAILRFFHEWQPERRRINLGVLWLFAWLTALALTIGFDLLSRRFSGFVIRQVPYEPYLRLTLWTAFFATFEAIPIALLRSEQKAGQYAVFTVGAFLLREILKLLALVWLRRGVLGVVEAGFYGSAVLALAYTPWILRRVQISLRFEYLRAPLAFSLPRVLGGVIDALAGILDRVVLEKFIPIGEVGGYEVARRFGNIVRDVNAPLKVAWVPYAIRLAIERAHAPNLLSRISSYYVAVLLSFAIGVSLISRDVILFFGKSQYAFASGFVPIFAAIFFLDGAFNLLGTNIYIAKRTFHAALAALISLGVLVAASLIFVPVYRVPGAFVALVFYRVVHGTVLYSIASRVYPLPYQWRKIGGMVGTAVLTFLVGATIHFQSLWISIAVKLILTAAFVLGVAFFILDGKSMYVLIIRRGRKPIPFEPAP